MFAKNLQDLSVKSISMTGYVISVWYRFIKSLIT